MDLWVPCPAETFPSIVNSEGWKGGGRITGGKFCSAINSGPYSSSSLQIADWDTCKLLLELISSSHSVSSAARTEI